MKRIIIGTNEHKLCDVTEGWIERHVRERQAEGQAVCAQVILKTESVNVALSTPQCSHGGGGGRHPNPREQEVLQIWNHHRLNEMNWTAGDFVSFVKQVRRFVC